MAGYYYYSMSNNARAAYADGEMPLSKWTKDEIIDALVDETSVERETLVDAFKGISLKTLRDSALEEKSWHHTSKFYNKTWFYGLNDDFVDSIDNNLEGVIEVMRETQALQKKWRAQDKLDAAKYLSQNWNLDFSDRKKKYGFKTIEQAQAYVQKHGKVAK